MLGELMLKGPVLRNNRCVIEFAESYFEVDPMVGGRIVSARSGTSESLTGPSVDPANYGSTFWTAPQADWSVDKWPPPPAIDNAPYTLSSDEVSCTLVGAPITGGSAAMNDLSVTKRFSADLAKGALVVDYTIKNQGTATKRLAPWEVTRVAPEGLTFFESESDPVANGGTLPPITRAEGCTWFLYQSTVQHHAKLFSDGKGWIAHATPQNLLLIKSFANLTVGAAAPGEAEIEVYAANPPGMPAARYVEVENQGAIADLPGGGMLTWTVRWYLRALTFPATPGSAELVSLVRQTIQ